MKYRTSMHRSQEPRSAEWALEAGQVRALSIGPGPRLLRVAEGSIWLTASGDADAPPEDVWLAAGDSVALDDGAEVVIEGWPQARFQLLVPPCRREQERPSISGWFSSLRAA